MFNWNKAFNKPGYECELYNIDDIVDSNFVKQTRKKLKVSQRLFSKILGISEKTVEKWEQGVNPVRGTSSRLLFLLEKYDFLINDLYEVKKSDEYFKVHNEYQVRIIPKKDKIKKNQDFKFVAKEGFINKDQLQVKSKACICKPL